MTTILLLLLFVSVLIGFDCHVENEVWWLCATMFQEDRWTDTITVVILVILDIVIGIVSRLLIIIIVIIIVIVVVVIVVVLIVCCCCSC